MKPGTIFDIGWLSLGDAVHALLRNYRALAVSTEEQATLGDPVAIGLNQQLTSYLSLGLLHLAADVLDTTNHLCKIFQCRDVCFSVLRTEVFTSSSKICYSFSKCFSSTSLLSPAGKLSVHPPHHADYRWATTIQIHSR